MNCTDWQARIAADESDHAAVMEHVSRCEECSEFAADLALNTAALRSIEIEPAAYVELCTRVMEAVKPRRRLTWFWTAAATTAAVAAMATIWITAPLRAPDAGPPKAIVISIPSPAPAPAIRTVAVHQRKLLRPRAQQPLTAIKLLTDDPNVVIIWLVDDKKGDGS